tara:strand:- start:3002 stop:3484 length:483 start_codon:yes stop_codon:yes gene_type:complete
MENLMLKSGDVIVDRSNLGKIFTIHRVTESYQRKASYHFQEAGYVSTCGRFLPAKYNNLYRVVEQINDPKLNKIADTLEKGDKYFEINNSKEIVNQKEITIRFNEKSYAHFVMFLKEDGGSIYFDHVYYPNTGKVLKGWRASNPTERKLNKLVGFDCFER